MANYVKSTNFASKDALAVGNPLKIVKGTELDAEFNNIATAVSTKADTLNPAFTGTPTAPTASAGNNTTQLATTAFVTTAVSDGVTAERSATATLTNKTLTSPSISSPTLTGTPIAPTASVGTNTTQVATTAFVQGEKASPTFTGTTTVSTLSLGTNWTVLESGGVLFFRHNGVNKAKLDSSGNLTVTGNVTAYGSV